MLNRLPGFLFNPRSLEVRDCSGFGRIELITKVSAKGTKTYKLDGEGRFWFYYQLICGDKVDTYHPFPKSISDKKFYDKFCNVKDDKEAWTLVAEMYKEHYGDATEYQDWTGTTHKGTWIDILQTYVDVVHMQRWEHDRILVHEVLDKFDLL